MRYSYSLLLVLGLLGCAKSTTDLAPRAVTSNGIIEGVLQEDIVVYKGVPFAEAPVGDLRWHEPVAHASWDTVYKAYDFGPDPMQPNIFGDMNLLGKGRSEDCLYLNIWAPAEKSVSGYPVLIYFNGGGLMAGSGSEPRYAGDSLAHYGVISITANYREGIFGFFAHPELSAESNYHASGNYGFLDQIAAIKWVHENIAAFGGDPSKITIAGESAGSFSVSALMTSPLVIGKIAGAIGSSGAELKPYASKSLKEAEQIGVDMVNQAGFADVASLRALPAEELQMLFPPRGMSDVIIDNYAFLKSPDEVYMEGAQAQIPLLAGWNTLEGTPDGMLRGQTPTVKNFKEGLKSRFGTDTDEVLKVYGITSDEAVVGWPAIDLCSDLFTGFVTWKWCDIHSKTCAQPVYRYKFGQPRPAMTEAMQGKVAGLAGGVRDRGVDEPEPTAYPAGAVHSADIEYAMGNLSTNEVYAWTDTDYAVSAQFVQIYANFVKYGNPNGAGVLEWTPINAQTVAPVMYINAHSEMKADASLEKRYQTLDRIFNK